MQPDATFFQRVAPTHRTGIVGTKYRLNGSHRISDAQPSLPRQLVLFLADREGEAVAGALCLRGGDTLYGRYWGATELHPGLHFETCYYQGIAYCLREGLARFEPGAQGEHKIARGFLPAWVRSRHWIADPEFAGALAHWCDEESQAVRRYARTLQSHSPFKQQDRA